MVSLPTDASVPNPLFGRSCADSILKLFLLYTLSFDLLFNFFPGGYGIAGS